MTGGTKRKRPRRVRPEPVARAAIQAIILTAEAPLREAHLGWRSAAVSEVSVRAEIQDIHRYLGGVVAESVKEGHQLQVELGSLSSLTGKLGRIRGYTLGEMSQFRLLSQPWELSAGLSFVGRFTSDKDWARLRDECIGKAFRKSHMKCIGEKREWEETWFDPHDGENGYLTQLRRVRMGSRPARLVQRTASRVRYIYNPHGDTRREGWPRDSDFKVQLVETSEPLLPTEAAGTRPMVTWRVSAESYEIDDCRVDFIEVRQDGRSALRSAVSVRLSERHVQRLLKVQGEDQQYTEWADGNGMCVSRRQPLYFPRAVKLTAKRLFATLCALAAMAKSIVYEDCSTDDEK
jgi:hypothetical protein